MKKIILFACVAVLGSITLLLNGCKKDDTTPPEVSITGGNSRTVSLGSSIAAPTATADDGSSVTSNWSASNPDFNTKGTYTITYSATDEDGNTGDATLTVIVVNDAESLAGNYHVSDSVVGDQVYLYDQTITTDANVNNRIHFSKFANYTNNGNIYANKTSATTMDLPSQTALNIGSLSESHTFSGSAVISGSNFLISYTDMNNTASASATGYAAYVKF
jgi:hypothetical protein